MRSWCFREDSLCWERNRSFAVVDTFPNQNISDPRMPFQGWLQSVRTETTTHSVLSEPPAFSGSHLFALC